MQNQLKNIDVGFTNSVRSARRSGALSFCRNTVGKNWVPRSFMKRKSGLRNAAIPKLLLTAVWKRSASMKSLGTN